MMRPPGDIAMRIAVAATSAPMMLGQLRSSSVRKDPWVQLVIIAIALILAVGLLAAWWMTCQARGMYPAFDMPNWQNGGTFKAYCRS